MSELNSGSSDVRRTRRNCNGPKSFKPHSMGVASISVHGGLGRDTNGLTGFDLVGGSVMWPARSNASIKPRHIMSHLAPPLPVTLSYLRVASHQSEFTSVARARIADHPINRIQELLPWNVDLAGRTEVD